MGALTTREYVYNFKELQDIEIMFEPVEGDGIVYVNPGVYFKDPANSLYKLDTVANKRILIPKFEMQQMALTNKVIVLNKLGRVSYSLENLCDC